MFMSLWVALPKKNFHVVLQQQKERQRDSIELFFSCRSGVILFILFVFFLGFYFFFVSYNDHVILNHYSDCHVYLKIGSYSCYMYLCNSGCINIFPDQYYFFNVANRDVYTNLLSIYVPAAN